ncbi:MAG: riboflavin synthase [Verrucomicrobiota bacterium]|nr:riboflavin synthase [Verrucomicrobiota bacterium]
MFTGLVEEIAEVVALHQSAIGGALHIRSARIGPTAQLGDSIAVNGCCLTVSAQDESELTFDLLAETLARTNLGALTPGAGVNLERALSAGGRLGGHFVHGHIDCAVAVRAFEKIGADWRLELDLPREFARYVVAKGSIAINGVSLTVAELSQNTFVVWIIPHTFSATNFSAIKTGDLLNIEFDLLAKYVERLVAHRND